MSDSFEDLWSSSAPLPPKSKPQTLSSASSAAPPYSSYANSSKPDVFSLLASSGSITLRYGASSLSLNASAPSSCSITPSLSSLSTGVVRSSRGTPVPPTKPATQSSGDAFGDLFTSASNSYGNASMTLAARLALEAKQRQHGSLVPQKQLGQVQGHDSSAWAGLDLLGGNGFVGFETTSSSASKRQHASSAIEDDWGLGDFGAAPVSSASASKSVSTHTSARSTPQLRTQPDSQRPIQRTATTPSPWSSSPWS
ncbi:hypothetical protein BDZ97DRAFT_1840678 [Flammula alnicola]|nr:hypothetical protein BDZ97DRAFT_1840678 [Flammula alnicola]